MPQEGQDQPGTKFSPTGASPESDQLKARCLPDKTSPGPAAHFPGRVNRGTKQSRCPSFPRREPALHCGGPHAPLVSCGVGRVTVLPWTRERQSQVLCPVLGRARPPWRPGGLLSCGNAAPLPAESRMALCRLASWRPLLAASLGLGQGPSPPGLPFLRLKNEGELVARRAGRAGSPCLP